MLVKLDFQKLMLCRTLTSQGTDDGKAVLHCHSLRVFFSNFASRKIVASLFGSSRHKPSSNRVHCHRTFCWPRPKLCSAKKQQKFIVFYCTKLGQLMQNSIPTQKLSLSVKYSDKKSLIRKQSDIKLKINYYTNFFLKNPFKID